MKKTTTEQQIKKAAKQNNFAKFEILNLGIPNQITEVTSSYGDKSPYIPFGADNLFPQYLAEVSRQSPTHRAILGQKKILSIGKEFQADDEGLMDYIDDVNNFSETLRDVYGRLMFDYYTFGNSYLQIVKHDAGVNLYHIDATKVRIGRDGKSVYIHPNWSNYQATKKEAVIVPLYPEFSNNTAIIHFKDYEPTFEYYGLSDFISALKWLNIDKLIQTFNNTKFEQNFMPSAIVEINGDMGEEEAQKLVKEAQQKWVGQGNNSKILFIVKNGDQNPANVTMLNDSSDGSFMELQTLTSQNIITAHRWQPAMSGIVSSGKLSSTGNEIRLAWEMVMGTIIKDVENLVLPKIRSVINEHTSHNADDLVIIYEPPISYLSDIQAAQVLTLNEQREMLGFDPVELGDVIIKKETPQNKN